MAGAPCPVELMKQVVSDMHAEQITIAYGMTETSPVSFQSDTHDPLDRRVSTVGRILPHVEVKSIDADGWMHTGDLATLDREGYGNIVGRVKDMLIRGGENVYPREIEEYLFRHPAVEKEMSMTVTGKPQKFLMREAMVKDLGLALEKTA